MANAEKDRLEAQYAALAQADPQMQELARLKAVELERQRTDPTVRHPRGFTNQKQVQQLSQALNNRFEQMLKEQGIKNDNYAVETTKEGGFTVDHQNWYERNEKWVLPLIAGGAFAAVAAPAIIGSLGSAGGAAGGATTIGGSTGAVAGGAAAPTLTAPMIGALPGMTTGATLAAPTAAGAAGAAGAGVAGATAPLSSVASATAIPGGAAASLPSAAPVLGGAAPSLGAPTLGALPSATTGTTLAAPPVAGTAAASTFSKYLKQAVIAKGIDAAGNVISGVLANKAAQKAADQQLKANAEALALQKQIYEQTRADFAPYRESGAAAMGTLSSLMGLPGGGGGSTAPNAPLQAAGMTTGSGLTTRQPGDPEIGVHPGQAPPVDAPTPYRPQVGGVAVSTPVEQRTASSMAPQRMRAPDGSEEDVPGELVSHFEHAGAVRV